jgi:hypothetical protein
MFLFLCTVLTTYLLSLLVSLLFHQIQTKMGFTDLVNDAGLSGKLPCD